MSSTLTPKSLSKYRPRLLFYSASFHLPCLFSMRANIKQLITKALPAHKRCRRFLWAFQQTQTTFTLSMPMWHSAGTGTSSFFCLVRFNGVFQSYCSSCLINCCERRKWAGMHYRTNCRNKSCDWTIFQSRLWISRECFVFEKKCLHIYA